MTNYSTVSIYNRYYEVNEMDLTVAKTKTKIKNTGMTYVSIFGLTLLLGLVKYMTHHCVLFSHASSIIYVRLSTYHYVHDCFIIGIIHIL